MKNADARRCTIQIAADAVDPRKSASQSAVIRVLKLAPLGGGYW